MYILRIFVIRYFFQILSEKTVIRLRMLFYNFFLFNPFEFCSPFVSNIIEHRCRCSLRSNHDVTSPRHDPLQVSERDAMWHHRAKTTDDVINDRDVSTSLYVAASSRGSLIPQPTTSGRHVRACTCTRVRMRARPGRILLARTMTNHCWLCDDCRRFLLAIKLAI